MIMAQVQTLVLKACPQLAAFPIPFSQCTHKTPSTYVYTLFVSDLILVNFEALDKMSRQTLLKFWHFTFTRVFPFCDEDTLHHKSIYTVITMSLTT